MTSAPVSTFKLWRLAAGCRNAEAEEVRRILLALTDAYRHRPADLARTLHAATELDLIQARARLSVLVSGVEPVTSTDGTFELRAARHPLLIPGLGLSAGALAKVEGPARNKMMLIQPSTRPHGAPDHRGSPNSSLAI